jgi:pimeloyl-ACP methyl ester carboxylesterase
MQLAHVRWKSASTTEKIVFLHGMGGTGALWRPVAADLESRYDVLALDQRGHGGSRVSPATGIHGYAPINYGRDVVETMELLGFHPAWLVGHSMGVRTACAAAHLRPDFTRGIVLVDLGFSGAPGGEFSSSIERFLAKLPREFPSRSQARAFIQAECPDLSIAKYLLAGTVSSDDGRVSFPFDHDGIIETLRAARGFSIRDWVRELAERGIPILALRGEQSNVWSSDEFEAERKHFSDLPLVRFREIAGAGHGLPFEKRAEFIAELVAFCASH